jgi:hypothetical protein
MRYGKIGLIDRFRGGNIALENLTIIDISRIVLNKRGVAGTNIVTS